MTFDPYLTFAEGERGFREKMFLRSDGLPSATWLNEKYDGHAYLTFLWKVGRAAYAIVAERSGKQPKAEDFQDIADAIKEIEKKLAPVIEQLIQAKKLTLRGPSDSHPVKNPGEDIKDAVDGWLLETFMRVVRPSVISGHLLADDLPDFEGLLCATAVIYIDDYIICDYLDSKDKSMFQDLVQANISSAMLYRETLDAAKEAVSAIGRRSANVRHMPTNQQKAAALAEWDTTSGDYKSRADFARIIGKRDRIKERTLYEWIAAHEKSKA